MGSFFANGVARRAGWIAAFVIFRTLGAFQAGAITHYPVPQHTADRPLEIKATVSMATEVDRMDLFYRRADEDGFIEIEMDVVPDGWQGQIPLGYLTEEGIEYYISASLEDGTVVTFPAQDPVGSPQTVKIVMPEASQPEMARRETIGEEAILIFSPEPGSRVPTDAVLVSVSLFHVDSVDVSSVRLAVDGQDVTSRASVGTDLVVYEPVLMPPGSHRVRLTVKTLDGRAVEPKSWSFDVTGKLEKEVERALTYGGRINSGYSLDAIEGQSLSIGLTSASVTGKWRGLDFKTDLKFTTEEDPFKQPRNRYQFKVDAGRYFSLNLGDFNSRLSRFTLDGKRVRGLEANLKLGWVNFHLVRGELDRVIQGRLGVNQSLFLESVEATQNEQDSTKTDIIYRLNRKGFTFRKNISAARLSFGKGSRFQLGFNWLKAKDDIGSVQQALDKALIDVDRDSSGSIPLEIAVGQYEYGELRSEIDKRGNYRLVLPETDWEGDAPQDNIVLGSDIRFFLDRKRIGFEAGWAFSILNKDIWDGPFSLAGLDTLMDDELDGRAGDIDISGFPDPSEYEDIFVINENIVPLVPIDPDSALLADDPLKAILNMPSLAYYLKASARYLGNQFNFQYIKVGPEFNSLGNPYIQENNREYSVSDRVGLFRNRFLVHVIYKHQDDDILRTVENVTTTETFRTNLGLYPGGGLPTVTFSFRNQDRDNGKTTLDTVTVDTANGRIDLEDLRDFTRTTHTTVGVNHRLGALGMEHNVSVNYVQLKRADQYYEDEDRPLPPFFEVVGGDSVFVDSSFVSPSLSSQVTNVALVTDYPFGLRTTLTVSINKSTFGEEGSELYDYGDQDITGFTLKGDYRMLDGRLGLRGGVEITSGSGMEEFRRLGFGAGFGYRITDLLRFRFDGKLRSKSTNGETKSSTLLRASLNYSF
ncbi:MAG: hypothetical protein ACE5HZ_00670 [Fidelibacterota bacterium]